MIPVKTVSRHLSCVTALMLGAAALSIPVTTLAEPNLPELGDHSSGIVSIEQERKLGQQFLRSVLAQVPTVNDALLKDYVEHLIYDLAEHSELKDRRIETVVIDSPQLNAFAAPGGIVGVNKGIFLYAQTEHELAGILAHELAHLSQRHFARGLEQGRRNAVVTLAGLLATVVLMTTVGGDAGMAALMGAQGIAQQNQLKYSRGRESEADRVGINTLHRAGMDPRAMAHLFERLAQLSRFAGSRVPDFLQTHPVTRDRISDSYNQTASLPLKVWPARLDYQLMRARVLVSNEESPSRAEALMREKLRDAEGIAHKAGTYGLAYALIRQLKAEEALPLIASLRAEAPHKIAYTLAEARAHVAVENFIRANEVLAGALAISPENYPLAMAHADVLLKLGKPKGAQRLLTVQSQRRPGDIEVWYLLAEANGLLEDIPAVHQARAEYFLRTGDLDQAIKQLQFALPLIHDNFHLNAKVTERMREIHELRRDAHR